MNIGEVIDLYCPSCRRMGRAWVSGYSTARKCTCLTCGTVQAVDAGAREGTSAEGAMR